MRIGFVNTGSLQQNASTLRCLKLGRRLAQDGHSVFLFLTGQPENRECYGQAVDGIQMVYSAVGPLREQASKAALLSSRGLDYFHCMSAGSSVHFPAWLAKWRFGGRPRLIMDFDEWQSLWLPYPKRWYQAAWERFACHVSDYVIFASRYLLEHLGRQVHPSRRFYLPYAFDEEQFSTDRAGWETVRERYPGRRLAIYAGNLLPQYDAAQILDAVRPVCQAEPSVLFLIIGAGPLRQELERRARAAGLMEWVRFLGYVDDREMVQHLCAADVLLFPIRDTVLNRSRSPNKLFYYLAARRAIVTNPLPNVRDVLGDQALYFDFSSGLDFAQKILLGLRTGQPVAPEAVVAQHTYAARYSAYLEILGGRA